MDVRADIDMKFNRIVNLRDPIYQDDAVTKNYVDSRIDNLYKKDKILKDIKRNYFILKDTINLNTTSTGVNNIDEIYRKHINSSLNEVLENLDKIYEMLKDI